MSTDLEMLLRSTFAGRAATVPSGPVWTGPQRGVGPSDPHPHRRWIAMAAAAVLVIGVGVGIVALRDVSNRTEPAHPTPSVPAPTPTHAPTTDQTPTATPTPPPTNRVTTLASCATTLPASWTNALQNSVVDLGGQTVYPLAVAPDRSIVALRDDGVTPGSGREVVYAAPGGPPSVVYSIKQPDYTSVSTGQVSGPWLVLGLWSNPRPKQNVVPGNSAIGVQGIVVVNLETLESTLIAGIDTAMPQNYAGPTIKSFAVSNGVVYWDEEKRYTDTSGALRAYHLGTGKTATVYTGPIGYVTANAAGVGWRPAGGNGNTMFFAVRNTLPPVVDKSLTEFSRGRLQTDGSAYAWIESPTDVYWWKPGLSKPVHLTLPRGVGVDTDDGGGEMMVVGHMLVSDVRTPMVIDMQTGAVAPFPKTGLFDTTRRGELIDHTGSVFYGLAFTGTPGHFVNGYWMDTAMSALRVDISGLPDLTC